jgi:hypothetical protein
VVLPARLPNILVNGASGIAVSRIVAFTQVDMFTVLKHRNAFPTFDFICPDVRSDRIYFCIYIRRQVSSEREF